METLGEAEKSSLKYYTNESRNFFDINVELDSNTKVIIFQYYASKLSQNSPLFSISPITTFKPRV